MMVCSGVSGSTCSASGQSLPLAYETHSEGRGAHQHGPGGEDRALLQEGTGTLGIVVSQQVGCMGETVPVGWSETPAPLPNALIILTSSTQLT